MKIKILRSTVADGKDVFAGEMHDVSVDAAGTLIALGKAKLHVPETYTTDSAKTVFIETAEAPAAPERAEAPHAKKKR
jgi:hypothetical protein